MSSLAFAAPAMGTYAVGDRVFNDTNNNGVFDSGESGVNDVLLKLYVDQDGNCAPDGAALRSTRTNPSGAYLFTGVGSKRYLVELDAANFTGTGALVGFRSSTGSANAYEPGLNESNNAADNNKDHGTAYGSTIRACQIVIVGGTEPTGEGNQPPGISNPDTDPNTNNTIDFGVYRPATTGALGDRVWEDRNRNGLQDAGEPGVSGVTVRLLDSVGSALIATTATNSSGNYLFPNLAAGGYTVEFVRPVGCALTLADQGADQALDSDPPADTGRTTEGVVTAGQTNTQIDAGIYCPLSLGNLVWRDANNNGRVDGEPGIPGVTVELLNSSGSVVSTTLTNGAGSYLFSDLLPGDYTVRIPATNFAAGAPLAGFTSSTGNGSEPAPDPDTVATDSDDNGTAGSGSIASTPVTLASGTEPTGDGDDANGNLTVDFGVVPPVPPAPAAIGDRVWDDANRNGMQDNGEPGVPGVTVTLCTAGGQVIVTRVTGVDGSYLVSGLAAGSYQVGFTTIPAGRRLTTPNAGADASDSDATAVGTCTVPVTVAAGESNLTIDAGLVTDPPVVTPPVVTPPAVTPPIVPNPPVVVAGQARTTLSIRKTTGTPIVNRRATVVFTIVVRNTGSATAVNTRICDPITSGFAFVRARGGALRGGQVCWRLGNLAAGQSRTVRITLQATAAGRRTNVATVRADNAGRVSSQARIRVLQVLGRPGIPRVTG
jgi:uncharacterized repeat protein (TIGR01451 family)